MSLLREIRDAGLTTPLIGVLIGLLLIRIGFYTNNTLDMALLVFLLWVVVCIKLFRGRPLDAKSRTGSKSIVIPHLSILGLMAWLGSHEMTNEVGKVPIFIGLLLTWFSFYGLVFAAEEKSRLKNDEKAKN